MLPATILLSTLRVKNVFYSIFQPTRFFIHVVHESTEISPIYPLAQLQVDDPEDPHSTTVSSCSCSVLLFHARLYSQENLQCLTMWFCQI